MQRLLLNGSPRGPQSNSRLLLSWIAAGLVETGEAEPPVLDLSKSKQWQSQQAELLQADEVLLVFPLYTDSVPALVKAFFETLVQSAPAQQLRGKRLAFVIQGGFPESIHSEAVARYLARLCERIGCVHCGTIIKGGVEGIRIRPAWQLAKIRERFVQAGRELASQGRFSEDLCRQLAGQRTFNAVGRLFLRFLIKTGLINFYWNMMLKKHHAFAQRFDAPYGPALR